jgi:hypothetical protein
VPIGRDGYLLAVKEDRDARSGASAYDAALAERSFEIERRGRRDSKSEEEEYGEKSLQSANRRGTRARSAASPFL